jgi:hypothetical protein
MMILRESKPSPTSRRANMDAINVGGVHKWALIPSEKMPHLNVRSGVDLVCLSYINTGYEKVWQKKLRYAVTRNRTREFTRFV